MDTQQKATRTVITNLRRGNVLVYTHTWEVPWGTQATQAHEQLAPAVMPHLAKALGVPESDITFTITKGSGLSEGIVKLTSDKAASPAKAKPAASAKVDPKARVDQLAWALIQAHPRMTLEAARKQVEKQVAVETAQARNDALHAQLAQARKDVVALEATCKASDIALAKAKRLAK